ncbi:DEAD/DEAH box helicase [Nocardia grenadensis]|uniref:DEAD/DEAH box helicase n=1 Tax=Nocardia grenadensis TaxID=931537 RepID=UPI003D8CE32D
MDGSLFSPVVQLRNAFECLPGFLRTPIEMVVFGGELPGADISGMRRMVAELRARSLELEGHTADIDSLLTQEDSVGETAEQLRELLSSFRQGAARLGKDVNALADQGQAAANDAEKWLCVMFTFGIHLAWKVYGLIAAATAAGPGGQVAAAPAVESTLVQGRAEVAVLRANLQRAIQAGGAKAAAQLSGMGPAQFAKWMGTAVALPVGVEVVVQGLQVATGDRTPEIIGEDGSNPTGIDMKSIEVAAVSGAGGAVGGMLAGRFAPMVSPQIASSRVAMGLVHGTAGAISGLGAAALIAGWPQHYTEVLGPLVNGAFSGGVYAQSVRSPAIGGGAPFTPPDAISAGHDAETAASRQPIEISTESKRAWEAARQTWKPAAESANNAGERGGASAETARKAADAQPRTRGGQQASASADGAGGGTPAATGGRATEGAAGKAPEGAGGRASGSQAAASSDAAAARPRSETTATVERPQADKQGAAGRSPAPRSVEAAGETAPPPKLPAEARPAGGVPEKNNAPPGAHAAVADGVGNEPSARPRSVAEGDAGSPDARAEHGSPGGDEYATAQREATAEQPGRETPESTGRIETDGPDTLAAGDRSASVHDERNAPATDHNSLAEAAGLPRSDRDRAVDLLIDFHQASAEHVPESQRLSNLPDDVLKAGLHGGDEHQSMLATVEVIRRGTVSDALPGGMVLRVEQAEAVYAMRSRPVEMKPGEGKSLVFMATAIQRAVHHGSVLLVTTTDGLANREVVTYEKLLTDSTNQKLMTDFGIDVFRADQENGFGPIAQGRPAIVVATGETVGHLCNAGIEPPRHVLIDEMDGIIDRGERQFLRSEGPEQAAPAETARQVFDAHEFLTGALADGSLSHEDFGLRRIAEEIGVQADGTPEFMYWYDGQPELTAAGRAKVEALPNGENWLEGMGASRLETAANAEFLVRAGVHYEMDAGKIVIIDQAEHGLQRNPKTSSESRWSAEPGKASLAQAIEAKEIRAAEARGETAEDHQIVVRADAESAKRIDSVEIYRVGEGSFFDEVTGASGTLTDLNPVLQKIYGLEPAHEVGRSQTHRLVEGQHDVAENTHAKLRTIAEYANEIRNGGAGRFQEILCHRNDLVARQVEALVRAGVPREAIEAVDAKRIVGWGADWESQLQRVFDEAGEQGKILVINRQGQRGVDISVSDAVKAMGGMHVWMTEAPEQSYIHEQARNRTARNGQLGSAQVVMSPEDALIRNAMHLRGVRETVVHYEQAVAAHAADPTPRTHDAMVEARQSVRELVPELQQRALRHSTSDFIRHHAFSTRIPALTLAEADTGQYGSDIDFARPDGPADRTARLAGLLGIPAPALADQIAALERSGSLDPIRELLQRTGIAPAAAETLRQHVEATAPATTLQRALFTDEQALNHMMPLRNRLADELGLSIAAVDGAEGMRILDPALTEARDALASAMGYPAANIAPGIARNILGELVGDHLPAVNIAESDARDDTDSLAADSGPLGHGTRHETSQDAVAQQSDTRNSDADEGTADDIVAAASRYLALSALLDSVVQIHRRSPNSCVNNAVTGMRVLCPDNAGRFRLPPTSLEGYGREEVREIFGAGLEETGSLDEVVESLKSRPGGITVLVYKWKDARANGTSTKADDHMVLLVNDSTSVDEPNLVVVNLAASPDGSSENDYGPRDLRNRRTLLNKAVGFDDWRREQEVFINRMPADERRFETIEFDRDGNLVSGPRAEAPDAETLPQSWQPVVSSDTVADVESAFAGLPDLDEAMLVRSGAVGRPVPGSARSRTAGAPDSIGSRPSEEAARGPSPNNDPSAAAVPVAHIRIRLAELRAAKQANTLATERTRQLTEFADAVEELEDAAAAMARTHAGIEAENRRRYALSTVSSIAATVEAAARDTARHDEAVRILDRLGGTVVGQVHLVYAALFEHMRVAGQYVDEVDDTDEHELERSARQYESLVKQIDWLDALISVLEHTSPKDHSQQYRSLIDTIPHDPDPHALDPSPLQSSLLREATGSADRSTELEQGAAAAEHRHRAALAAVGELDRLLIPTVPHRPVDAEHPSTTANTDRYGPIATEVMPTVADSQRAHTPAASRRAATEQPLTGSEQNKSLPSVPGHTPPSRLPRPTRRLSAGDPTATPTPHGDAESIVPNFDPAEVLDLPASRRSWRTAASPGASGLPDGAVAYGFRNGKTPWNWRRKPQGEDEQAEPAQGTETADSAPRSISTERPVEGEGEREFGPALTGLREQVATDFSTIADDPELSQPVPSDPVPSGHREMWTQFTSDSEYCVVGSAKLVADLTGDESILERAVKRIGKGASRVRVMQRIFGAALHRGGWDSVSRHGASETEQERTVEGWMAERPGSVVALVLQRPGPVGRNQVADHLIVLHNRSERVGEPNVWVSFHTADVARLEEWKPLADCLQRLGDEYGLDLDELGPFAGMAFVDGMPDQRLGRRVRGLIGSAPGMESPDSSGNGPTADYKSGTPVSLPDTKSDVLQRVRRGETISDDQNYEWRQLRGRYELALARYLYNSAITRQAIVETVRRLREVLTGLHPEATSEQIDEAFFAPEIDRWDGIVRRSVPLEELLRDGNPRELMAALLNAMLRGGERNPPCSTTLDAGLIKLFQQPEWETAAADLGLDVPALRGVRASMLESTPLADLTVKDLHLVRHATLRTDAALRVFDEYDRRSRADVRSRTDENRRLLTVQDWALMGMPLSRRELEAVPGGLRAFRISRLDPDRIPRDHRGRVDADALEAQLKSEDSTVENVLPLYVYDERGRRVRDDSGNAVIRTVLVYHNHGIVDAAAALRLDPRRYAVRIPWRPGGARFDFKPNGAWFQEKAIEHKIPTLTGISGTTARMMTRFAWLRPPGVFERDFAGAVVAALYPHHTDYEIVQAMRMAGVSIVDESILDAADFDVTAFYRAVFSAFGYDISHVDAEEAVFYEKFFEMFGAEDELVGGAPGGPVAESAASVRRRGDPEGLSFDDPGGLEHVETPPDNGATSTASEPRTRARPTPWSEAAQHISDDRDPRGGSTRSSASEDADR